MPAGRPREELEARDDLEERYGDTIVIQIGSMSQELPQTEVVIPVTPPTRRPCRNLHWSLCRSLLRKRPFHQLFRRLPIMAPAQTE